MVYITLIALLFSVTNFIPVSAIGFAPICLCAWRVFDRRYPPFVTCLSVIGLMALGSTLLYDPEALLSYDFYRHDGNFFVSYAPILAGCLYSHQLDLDKALRRFFMFAVLANLPAYAVYVAQNGLLAIFADANDSFGSYFIARNAAGGFLAMLFCLGLSCYVKRRDNLVLGLLVLNAMFLFSTYSRGSMLGAATAIAYLLLGRKRWTVAVLMAVLVAFSFCVAWDNTRPGVNYMAHEYTARDADAKTANVDVRFRWLWPRALAYFEASPIVGMGFGSFDDEVHDVVNYFGVVGQPRDVTVFHTDAHAHNSYLHIAAELGVIGLALMLAFYWYLIKWAAEGAGSTLPARRSSVGAFVFVELSSVCLLAMGATEHRLTTPSNVLILALVVSLLLAWRGRRTGGAAKAARPAGWRPASYGRGVTTRYPRHGHGLPSAPGRGSGT
ncbi:O-antigen ligase domain-containing protein [Burkholderia multivorans]